MTDQHHDSNEYYQDAFPSKPSLPTVPAISDPSITIAVAPGRLVDYNKDEPDFLVFRGHDHGWVLRDPRVGRDYPFHSRDAAIAGAAKRVVNPHAFIGAVSEASVYGEPVEGVVKVYI